jgi:hypothetical protein
MDENSRVLIERYAREIARLEAERDTLRAAAKWLVEQADKCSFVDDHGHKLTMNKALCALRAALAKGGGK